MSQVLIPLGHQTPVTAFDRDQEILSGLLCQVVQELVRYCTREPEAEILLFDDSQGLPLPWPLPEPYEQLCDEVKAQADPEEGLEGLEPSCSKVDDNLAPRRAGRPRLGVVAREITLLPEQWAWLAGQPGGASATLRRLVEAARKEAARREQLQQAHSAAFRCICALGERLDSSDEVLLAIYAGDQSRFEQLAQHWPGDWRQYVRRLGFPA